MGGFNFVCPVPGMWACGLFFFFFFFWIIKNLLPKGQNTNKQLKIVQTQRLPEKQKTDNTSPII